MRHLGGQAPAGRGTICEPHRRASIKSARYPGRRAHLAGTPDLIVIYNRGYNRLACLIGSVEQKGSNALPQPGLLVEAIQFHAAEVKTRNDPDDPTVVDNRQM